RSQDAAEAVQDGGGGVVQPGVNDLLQVGADVAGLVGSIPAASAQQLVDPVVQAQAPDSQRDAAGDNSSSATRVSAAGGIGHLVLGLAAVVSGHTNGHFDNNAPFLG